MGSLPCNIVLVNTRAVTWQARATATTATKESMFVVEGPISTAHTLIQHLQTALGHFLEQLPILAQGFLGEAGVGRLHLLDEVDLSTESAMRGCE